jgi:hypothetical protein
LAAVPTPTHRFDPSVLRSGRAFLEELRPDVTRLESASTKKAVLRAIETGDLSDLSRLRPSEKRSLLTIIDERLGGRRARPDPRAIVELTEALSLIGIHEQDGALQSNRPGR